MLIRQGGFWASATSGFTPASVAGLLFWHESGVGLTVSGSNYTAWADQSGNSRNWTTGARPPLTGRTINGRAAPDFDGGDNMFMATNGGFAASGHIMVGAVFDTFVDQDYVFEDGALAVTDVGFHLRMQVSSGNKLQVLASNGTTRTGFVSGVIGTGSPVLYQCWYAAGTNASGVKVGGSATTGTLANIPSSTWTDNLILMAHGATGGWLDGAVAITLGYSSPISGANLTNLESYCNSVLGI